MSSKHQKHEEAALNTLERVRKQMVRREKGSGNGILVAEGDSWFSLPGSDVLDELEDLGYDVESVAHPGDTIESMAYTEGQLSKLTRLLNRLANRKKSPRSILISGGGNDIVGDGLTFLLNHKNAGLGDLNNDLVKGLIDDRLFEAYDRLISIINALNKRLYGKSVRIIVHGYDYAVPDGRGFLGGWWILPGPWLKPAFNKKGYEELSPNRQTIHKLIDRFNIMLERLANNYSFVRYVNVRGTLNYAFPQHKKDWKDELHPREHGFEAIAKKIAEAVEAP